MIVQGRSSKSSSSSSNKYKNSKTYYRTKHGMKVAADSAAGRRMASSGNAQIVRLDNGDGGYVRKNRDGTTTSYNSGYSTGSRRSSGGGGGAYRSYLDDARRSAMDAQKARVQSAIDSVAAQQSEIKDTADKNAQQAYIAKMKNMDAAPQQLAALGKSGGASESTWLGINTDYENNQNKILENMDKAIQQNEQQQNQIRASGDASIADIENAYAAKLAQYEADQEQYEKRRQDQLNDIQDQHDYEQEIWDRNNAYAAKLAAQKAAKTGTGLKSSGSTPSFSNLMKLYDTTGNPKYLEAAEQSAGIVGQTPSGSYSPEISNYISQIDKIVQFNQNSGLPYQYGLAEGINRKYQNGELTKEQAEAIARKYGL